MEARTATRQHTTHPFSYYWDIVKTMDDSQKLQLIAVLADSIRPTKTVAADGEYSLRPFTPEELNARIDQAEADIAAGRVIDDDDVWADFDEELAREEQGEMTEAL